MREETPHLERLSKFRKTHGIKKYQTRKPKEGEKGPTLKEQNNKNKQILLINNFPFQWSPSSPPPQKTQTNKEFENIIYPSTASKKYKVTSRVNTTSGNKGWIMIFQANEPK